jgi:hypothetical protein
MKYFKILLLLLISSVTFAQVPTLEDLPRSIIREWKKDVKETERAAREAAKDGFDIVPDPIETPVEIPVNYFDPGSLEIVSWQTQLQRMPELEARIKAECTYPVHFKISDSGVDQTHKDLAEGFIKEYDWTGEGHAPGTHGTHVAGDILQFMYPLVETGVVTYDDQKSLRASGSGSFAWAANMFHNNTEDVERRTAAGQTVIWNCSWGGGTSIIESVETQMRKNVEAGAIIVAVAGNSGGAVGYPGKSEQVWGITSLDESMIISSFSSRGPEVDGTAGGRNIYSTLPGNRYGLASGTSMASPSFAAIFIGYARAKWGPDLLPDYDALRTYYKQIAVQVGNGDPELYAFGYPYIEAILNTRPGGDTPPDDPDEPDNPTPDPGAYYVSGIADAGYLMRWKYEGDAFFRLLYVPYFEWETVYTNGEDEAYHNAKEIIDSYFLNRAIVLPPEMDAYSATWWTGQFLEYVARNQHDTDLDIIHLIGQDEFGNKYSARDFDKADLAAVRSLLQQVYLIDVE